MNQEEIIRMAREAGIYGTETGVHYFDLIEDFAYLVAAKEREACAKVAAWILKMPQNDVSAAIRGRGEK
jgi:hypothetical protein